MSERHEKWTRVEAGTIIPAGQPYRAEYPVVNPVGTEAIERVSSSDVKPHCHPVHSEDTEWFVDSSWKPPLVLPTEPTWGIAVHAKFDRGWGFGRWHLDGDEFWQDSDTGSFSWRPHSVRDFIELTPEQVARIEAAR